MGHVKRVFSKEDVEVVRLWIGAHSALTVLISYLQDYSELIVGIPHDALDVVGRCSADSFDTLDAINSERKRQWLVLPVGKPVVRRNFGTYRHSTYSAKGEESNKPPSFPKARFPNSRRLQRKHELYSAACELDQLVFKLLNEWGKLPAKSELRQFLSSKDLAVPFEAFVPQFEGKGLKFVEVVELCEFACEPLATDGLSTLRVPKVNPPPRR